MRILLVDDDARSIDTLERVLQEAGYETAVAADGAAALDQARQERPDLVISEVLLPVMDGHRLLRAWLSDPVLREVPFAFLAASFTSDADKAFAHALGAIRCWKKPFSPKEIVEQVDGLIQMGREGTSGHPLDPAPSSDSVLLPYDQSLVLSLKRGLEASGAEIRKLKAALEEAGPMLVGVEIASPGRADDPLNAEARHNAAYRISDAVHGAPSLGELFRAIHEIIASLVDTRNFTIALHDPDQDILSFPYDSPGSGAESPNTLHRCLIEHVLKTGRPFIGTPKAIHHLAAEQGFRELAAEDLAWLGVPLRGMDRIIGVLAIDHSAPGFHYTRGDAEMLGFVATQVALAIEKKRAEAEMLLLTSAIEQVSEAIFITDQDGVFVYVNPAFEYHSGYMRAELSGRNTDLLRSPETPQGDLDDLWKSLRQGDPWGGLIRMQRKGGSLYLAQVTASPVKNDLGEIAAFVFVQRDVTHEVTVQEQLQRARSLETVGLLAQGIAHEVRNPLFAINLNMAAMDKVLGDQTSIRPFMGFIQEQVKRLDVLMKDLLELGQPLDKEEFIPTTVQAILRDVARQVESSGDGDGRLVLDLAEEPMPIHAVFAKLKLVFLQLVTNAFQNSGPRDRVFIHTEQNNLYWIIRVEDEGAGIPDELTDRLFDPFVTTHEGHRGLGLTMVRHYLAEHRGTASAMNNAPRPGATFTVILPKEAGEP